MKIRLDEIVQDKPVRKNLEFDRRTVETVSGPITAENVSFIVQFQQDPMGFVLHYWLETDAEMVCIRCGGDLKMKIKADDWMSLRTEQPEASHLVLGDAELNIRFLEDLNFDLGAFLDEVIELELPAYPKHENPVCSPIRSMDDSEENKGDSPFSALADLLKK